VKTGWGESELEKKAVATLLLMRISGTYAITSPPCPQSREVRLSLPTSPAAEREACVLLCSLQSISACVAAASEQFPIALRFALETWQRESFEDDSDIPSSPWGVLICQPSN